MPKPLLLAVAVALAVSVAADKNFWVTMAYCDTPDCDDRNHCKSHDAPTVFINPSPSDPSCNTWDTLSQGDNLSFDPNFPADDTISFFRGDLCGQTVDFYGKAHGSATSEYVVYDFYIHNGDGTLKGTCYREGNGGQSCQTNVGSCRGKPSYAATTHGVMTDGPCFRVRRFLLRLQ